MNTDDRSVEIGGLKLAVSQESGRWYLEVTIDDFSSSANYTIVEITSAKANELRALFDDAAKADES